MGNYCSNYEPPPSGSEEDEPTDIQNPPPIEHRSPQMEELYQIYQTGRRKNEAEYKKKSGRRYQQLIDFEWMTEVKKIAREGYSTMKIKDRLNSEDREKLAKWLINLFGDGIKVYYENKALHITWDPQNTELYPRIYEYSLPDSEYR